MNHGFPQLHKRRLVLCTVTSLILVSSLPSVCQSQTLHAVIVADTLSPDIKADMNFNFRTMKAALTTNIPGNRLNFVPCIDRDFRREKVIALCNDLPVRDGDTVLLYYCGHATYDVRAGTICNPVADHGAALHISELRKPISAKKPKFFVTILDCCSIITARPNAYGAPAPGEEPQRVSPLFEKLFFEQTGELVINSSAPGEYALCRAVASKFEDRLSVTHGSTFTFSLTSILSHPEKPRDWQNVIQELREKVDDQFKLICPEGRLPLGDGDTVDQETQTVWAIRNGRVWFDYR